MKKHIYKAILSMGLIFTCIASCFVESVMAQTVENAEKLYEDTDGSAAEAIGDIAVTESTDPELGDCRKASSETGYTYGDLLTAHACVKFDMSELQMDMDKKYVMIGMDYKTNGDFSKLGVIINGSRHLISDEAGDIAGKYKKDVWNSVWVIYDMTSETNKNYGDSLVYINGIQCSGNGMIKSERLARIKWNDMVSLEMVFADKTNDGLVDTFIDNVRFYQTDDIDTVLGIVNDSKFDVAEQQKQTGEKEPYNGVLTLFRDRDADSVKNVDDIWTIEQESSDETGEYKKIISSDYVSIAAHKAYAALDVDMEKKDLDNGYRYLLVGVNFKTNNKLERLVLTGNNNKILISGYNTGFIGGGRYSKTDWNKVWFVYDINSESNYSNFYGDSMVYINGKQQYGTGFMASNRNANGGIRDLSSIGLLFANKESSDTSETTEISIDDIRIYMADDFNTVNDVLSGHWTEPATPITDVKITGEIRRKDGISITNRESVQFDFQYDEQIDLNSFDTEQILLNGQRVEDIAVDGRNVHIDLSNLKAAKSYTLSLKNVGKDICGVPLAESSVKFRTVSDIDVEKMEIYKDFSKVSMIETGMLTPRITGIRNNTEEEKTITAFSVLTKNGVIEKIDSKPIIIPANQKINVCSFEINVPEDTEKSYVLKMFLWDSISNGVGYIKHIELR